MKCHFDYNPYNDNLIPCKEAGLKFSKGEILQIVNREDPNWWQVGKKIKISKIKNRKASVVSLIINPLNYDLLPFNGRYLKKVFTLQSNFKLM